MKIKNLLARKAHIPVFLLDLVLLAVVFWVVRYWHSSHFGLYEDDITIIPGAIAQQSGDLLRSIWESTISFEGQGRPLHHGLIQFLSKFGYSLNHLQGLYWTGYTITLINIGLFYWLMVRVANRNFALIAGLCYVLYSADTTQAYLTLSLGVQPSLTFLLLAFHSYLSGRYALGYLLATVILFGYETPFPVFLAAPLLLKDWNKKTTRKWILHGVLVGVILLVVYLFRIYMGSGLRDEISLRDMIVISIKHVLKGPLVSLGSYFYRPVELIKLVNPEIWIAVIGAFIFFYWLFSRLTDKSNIKLNEFRLIFKLKRDQSVLINEILLIIQLIFSGIVMLAGSYALSFTVSTGYIAGRATRVHMPGVMGASVLLACGIYFLVVLSKSVKWQRIINIAIALEMSLMVGYGFIIQRDYVIAWQYQQRFWSDLLPIILDASPNTVILVNPSVFSDVSQIGANTWNLPRILNQIYIFPPNEKNIPDLQAAPRVFRLTPGWEQSIVTADGKFQLNGTTTISPPSLYKEVDSHQVIFINGDDGKLFRENMSLKLAGTSYVLKPLSEPVLSELPHGLLYPLLITEP
jgi:hypothetical protein